jgi:hypothetical protein
VWTDPGELQQSTYELALSTAADVRLLPTNKDIDAMIQSANKWCALYDIYLGSLF